MNLAITVREEDILAVRRTIDMHRKLAEGKRASAGAAAEDQAEKFLDTALAHEDVALHLERALVVLFGEDLPDAKQVRESEARAWALIDDIVKVNSEATKAGSCSDPRALERSIQRAAASLTARNR